MTVLVDTNVLLRMAQPDHESNAIALSSVAKLLQSGERLCCTLQNIAEFWNVATRPIESNGLGLAVEFVAKEIEALEREFSVLPDVPAIYQEWKGLVMKHRVLGSKVHDARLVAAMRVNGLRRILTFNTQDFGRYGVEAVHPSSVS